jgi:nuclease HARBI1
MHWLKFQSIMLPDGLICHLSGPWNGSRHDAGIFYESGVRETVGLALSYESKRYFLYEDLAYPIPNFVIAPYKGARLDKEQLEFNKRMWRLRECVE